MKTNLFKIAAIALVVAGGFGSCREKESDACLSGLYIQTYPKYSDDILIKINFVDGERLEIIRSVADKFIYSIQGASIKLTTVTHNPEITTEHYFRVINSRKFEIGFLDGYIPEETPPNMIFEKETECTINE